MSILIKGMEMPKKGLEIEISINWDGKIYARPKQPLYAKQKPSFDDWYEVVELPPHGRLIDADELDKAFTELRWDNNGLAHWGDRKDWCMHGNEIEALISAAPTIIPAEEGAPTVIEAEGE